jgi:hypothetical protein
MARIQGQGSPLNYYLEVSRGNIPGAGFINKFGRNLEIDSGTTADVWDGGKVTGGNSLVWVAPTQARIHALVSTSTDDDGSPVGLGARTVRIWGLTGWDTDEVFEDVIMDGTDPVNTSNSYVIIHRMRVLTNGGTSNVGDIAATAAVDGTVTARMLPTEGQTQMCIYGVPSTKDIFFLQTYAAINKGSAGGSAGYVDVILQINQTPQDQLTGFVNKRTFGLSLDGSSQVTRDELIPSKFAGPALLKLEVSSATNNMDVSGGFTALLINKP